MAKVLLINGSPRENGNTKMVEKVPSLNIEEQAGTINLFDYLKKGYGIAN